MTPFICQGVLSRAGVAQTRRSGPAALNDKAAGPAKGSGNRNLLTWKRSSPYSSAFRCARPGDAQPVHEGAEIRSMSVSRHCRGRGWSCCRYGYPSSYLLLEAVPAWPRSSVRGSWAGRALHKRGGADLPHWTTKRQDRLKA